MDTWLVTGASGFLGRHVLDSLNRSRTGTERIVGLTRAHKDSACPGVEWVSADMLDPRALSLVVAKLRPTRVIHLAGRTSNATASTHYHSNILGTIHLLRSLSGLAHPVRLVIAGSAAELGPVPSHFLPASPELPCRPAPGYGLSKWAASKLVLLAKAPIDGIVGRVFNPIGPGMPRTQAFGRFATLLASAAADPLTLSVGNIDARRDFVDVRDVAAALISIARKGRRGVVYHIGSGRSRSVAEGLDLLIAKSGRDVSIRVDQGASANGPADSVACIASLTQDTGWRPSFAFEQSLSDLWQERITVRRLDLMTIGSAV